MISYLKQYIYLYLCVYVRYAHLFLDLTLFLAVKKCVTRNLSFVLMEEGRKKESIAVLINCTDKYPVFVSNNYGVLSCRHDVGQPLVNAMRRSWLSSLRYYLVSPQCIVIMDCKST